MYKRDLLSVCVFVVRHHSQTKICRLKTTRAPLQYWLLASFYRAITGSVYFWVPYPPHTRYSIRLGSRSWSDASDESEWYSEREIVDEIEVHEDEWPVSGTKRFGTPTRRCPKFCSNKVLLSLRVMSSGQLERRCLARRFWNHVFTWRSLSCSWTAKLRRSSGERYLLLRKRFSKIWVCCGVNRTCPPFRLAENNPIAGGYINLKRCGDAARNQKRKNKFFFNLSCVWWLLLSLLITCQIAIIKKKFFFLWVLAIASPVPIRKHSTLINWLQYSSNNCSMGWFIDLYLLISVILINHFRKCFKAACSYY